MTREEAEQKALRLLNDGGYIQANIAASLIAAHNAALEEAGGIHDRMAGEWGRVALGSGPETERNGMIDLHQRYAAAIRARKIT